MARRTFYVIGITEILELRVDMVTSNDPMSPMPGGYDPNFVHCPSETTSTEPSTTLMAVCSSMA